MEMTHEYKICFGKHHGKSPFGKSRSDWEDNINMDVIEVGSEGMDWIHMLVVWYLI
jgi:hypothetical protein